MASALVLAVAGSRKTQGLVDYCAGLPATKRVLLLTYTTRNQDELRRRIAQYAGDHPGLVVMGWFTFLLRHLAKPFLPFKFPGTRVRGFNFEGRPHLKAKGKQRFLDSNGCVYGCELSRLASELIAESRGALMHRLSCLFDEILIDEVQDLSAHDWDIVDILLRSSIDLRMVGDIRQAVIATNPRSGKNKMYAYSEAIDWFRARQKSGILRIEERVVTWRCHEAIANFSDSIFSPKWAFPPTQSMNTVTTGHDGVFLVSSKLTPEYTARFRPQCLQHSVSSGAKYKLDSMNFKVSKGATFERVLIAPTKGIAKFLQEGRHLEPLAAASFYVAVTRAQQSVAIILDKAGRCDLPRWTPGTEETNG